MIIKWETGGYYKDIIRPIECTRESETCIWIMDDGKERKRLKETDYHQIHDSWDAALRYLITKAMREEAILVDRLSTAREKVSMLSLLTKPDDAGVKP